MNEIDNGVDDAERAIHFSVPTDPRSGRIVRDAFLGFGREHGVPDADICDLVTAVGEAIANAIEHAQTSEPIEVSCRFEQDQLIATVVDVGVGFEPPSMARAELPAGNSERGRGLPIMRQYADIFAVRSRPGAGTAVVLGRYIRQLAEGARRVARDSHHDPGLVPQRQ